MQASGRSSSLPPAPMISLLGEQVAGAAVPNAAGVAFAKAETCRFDLFSCAFAARDLPWSEQALAIVLHPDPELTSAYPVRQGSRMTVILEDGRQITRELDNVVLATPDLVRARFGGAASAVIGDAQTTQLGEPIEELAHGGGAAPLIELCSPARP